MKKAIYTIMIGDDPMYDYSFKAMQRYAKKVNADLISRTKTHYADDLNNGKRYRRNRPVCSEKLYVRELLKQYDRVLYLDADILITPHAADIFQQYPRLDTVYMFDEGSQDRTKYVQGILSVLPCNNAWPTNGKDLIYYNAGLILCSKDSNIFALAKLDELRKSFTHLGGMYEQTYWNYLIVRHQLRSESVSSNYNRMAAFGDAEDRFNAYFIHHAGRSYTRKKKYRSGLLIKDYRRLYDDHESCIVRYAKDIKYIWLFYKNSLRRLAGKIKKYISSPMYHLRRACKKIIRL